MSTPTSSASAAANSPNQGSVAPSNISVLDRRIDDLDNVGESRARAFKHLGVSTLGDLLEYFPRTYLSESAERDIAELTAGEQIQTARGEVVAVDYLAGRPRQRFEATIQDESNHKLGLVWFNAAYLRSAIHPGMFIRVQGRVRFFRNMPQMAHPKWKEIEPVTERIEQSHFRPIYPATARLQSDAIARIVEKNLGAALGAIDELFSADLLKKRKLMPRRDAYRAIHRPVDMTDAMRARKRIVYDELMLMQLALGLSKRLRDGRITAPVLRIDKLLDERIRQRFPFPLTHAQQAACFDIVKDVRSGIPMNRLLQGDVGSGKTVVALYAMLAAVANKMQAALLAPTEILAEQHFLTLSNFLHGSNVTIELFTQRTRRAAKATMSRRLADGKIHLAVGTQALLQQDVAFANLGLIVVDEQHKLGVQQRAILRGKGSSPHYLVMTATPIPRTLALSYFADFDLSTIDELPPGRQPIETTWLRTSQSADAYAFIRSQASRGRQTYIVLPQIEGDSDDGAKSVLKEHDRLTRGPLSGLRLAALHGRLDTAEKQSIMNSFRNREIDVLVATTVIEVGIDVPNATVMLIDNADRFGLSQLHQLRGRVGRGAERSYCLLLSDAPTESAHHRLSAMTQTGDGFKIAELDLQQRGPGHFFGTRQHGLPEFKLADITSEIELLKTARDDALAILATDPKLLSVDHGPLKAALHRQFGPSLQLAQVG